MKSTRPNAPLPVLAAGDVHIWRVALDVAPSRLEALATLLSPDERDRAARFAIPELKLRFAAGRGILRRLLGRYVGSPPHEIRFTYGATGKPELVGGCCQFNLSHTGDQALIAIAASGPVGIDLELVRTVDVDAMARTALPESDILALAQAPHHAKIELFFRLWVRHEARVKAMGVTLGTPATLPVYDIEIAPPYCAALATPIDTPRIQLLQYDPNQ